MYFLYRQVSYRLQFNLHFLNVSNLKYFWANSEMYNYLTKQENYRKKKKIKKDARNLVIQV